MYRLTLRHAYTIKELILVEDIPLRLTLYTPSQIPSAICWHY